MRNRSRVDPNAKLIQPTVAHALIDPEGTAPCRVNAQQVPQPTAAFKGIESKIIEYAPAWEGSASAAENLTGTTAGNYFTGQLGAGLVPIAGSMVEQWEAWSTGTWPANVAKGDSTIGQWPGFDNSLFETLGTRRYRPENYRVTDVLGAKNQITEQRGAISGPGLYDRPEYDRNTTVYPKNPIRLDAGHAEVVLSYPRNLGSWSEPQHMYEMVTQLGIEGGGGLATDATNFVGFEHVWCVTLETPNVQNVGSEPHVSPVQLHWQNLMADAAPHGSRFTPFNGTVHVEYRNQATGQWIDLTAVPTVTGFGDGDSLKGGTGLEVHGQHSILVSARCIAAPVVGGKSNYTGVMSSGELLQFNAARIRVVKSALNNAYGLRVIAFPRFAGKFSAGALTFDPILNGGVVQKLIFCNSSLLGQMRSFASVNSNTLDQISQTRGTAHCTFVTFMGSSLRDGGQIAGIQMAPGLSPADAPGGDFLDYIRSVPNKGGDGPLREGSYLKWVPDGLESLVFQNAGCVNEFAGTLWTQIHSDDISQSTRAKYCAHIEATTQSQQYELGYANPAMDLAMTYFAVRALTPPWTCNPEHKGLKGFFNKVWGNFKKGIQSPAFWKGAWNVAKKVGPALLAGAL
jgi:hypothetical protein